MNAEEAKAHIRATLAGHRRAPLRRSDLKRSQPPPKTSDPPAPRLDAERVKALGFCVACYLSGRVVAAVAGGDGCRTHMAKAGVA